MNRNMVCKDNFEVSAYSFLKSFSSLMHVDYKIFTNIYLLHKFFNLNMTRYEDSLQNTVVLKETL